MYVQEQWLWDKELKQPVQYMGVAIMSSGPSKWHVKENGVEKVYEFNGFKWWESRYSALVDDHNQILMSNCKPGASQFYGGPFPDCVEITLKPSQPESSRVQCPACKGTGLVPRAASPVFLSLGYHAICERHGSAIYEKYYLAHQVDAYFAPFALTDHPDKCAQAIRDHNDSAVRLHNEATIRASKLAAENVELQRRMVLLTRRLTDLSARIKRTKRMISRFKIF